MLKLFGILVGVFFLSYSNVVFAEAEDPFLGVIPKTMDSETQVSRNFFRENFGFRKEIMSQFGTAKSGVVAIRQSVGFEMLKKFSSDTKTYAAIDVQGRMVWRDKFADAPNDHEGMSRPGLTFEYHNVYADFYTILNTHPGRFNARIGRFYVPFGLNLQTDTHGTVLQLSNERNVGFERDWYAGFWGNLNPALRYDLYYLVGSGYPLRFQGQSGLVAMRVGLSDKFLFENGMEGGISVISGQRLSDSKQIDTFRAGLDGRFRKPVSNGTVTWTGEISLGRDKPDSVATHLYQVDYLPASRKWGVATQFRQFWQSLSQDPIDSSLLAETTWYFNNDISNSNLQWIKLNCEYKMEQQKGGRDVIWTLQYYRYW